MRLRISAGPNAGRWWSLGSSGRGYVSGQFEADRVHAILSFLRAGDVFWDIGAHKGYISLAAARVVGPTGKVVAMEPSAENLTMLRRHVRWNNADTITILSLAASDVDGEASFGGKGSSVTHRLGRGDERVETRTIRSLIETDGHPMPDVIKIDTEGSEAAILRGALDFLSPNALIWISVHSRALSLECRELLEGRGFSVFESAAMAAAMTGQKSWGGDKELLAVGSERRITASDLQGLRLFRT